MTSSPAQHREALKRANEVRIARAQLKAKIASGEIFAASVLLDPPPETCNWKIAELLIAQRRWGVKRTRRFLLSNQVSEMKPVGKLTERQRRLLARALHDKSRAVDGSAGEGER